jgi:hypothetical protein
MLVLVSPAAVAKPDRLRADRIPKQLLDRGFPFLPRRGPLDPLFWRLLIEQSLTRFVIALSPFPAAMLIWPDLALPIAQAPLIMFGIVLFIESSVLSVSSPERRRALIPEADAARGLDLLRARARGILTRIAARRGLTEGALHLVVEQSAMARVAPLTFVSLQYAPGAAGECGGGVFLEPDPEESRILREELFAEGLDERLLQRINLAENRFLRDHALETSAVSAHARLAAMAEARGLLSARG